jgi:uncharacterized protein
MALTSAQVAAELRSVLDRIDATFDEAADRWTADRQLCLEDVESLLSALVQRVEADAS